MEGEEGWWLGEGLFMSLFSFDFDFDFLFLAFRFILY
jgi:hypothetical protein